MSLDAQRRTPAPPPGGWDGLPVFPKAVKVDLQLTEQRKNLRHATGTIRAKQPHHFSAVYRQRHVAQHDALVIGFADRHDREARIARPLRRAGLGFSISCKRCQRSTLSCLVIMRQFAEQLARNLLAGNYRFGRGCSRRTAVNASELADLSKGLGRRVSGGIEKGRAHRSARPFRTGAGAQGPRPCRPCDQ